MAGGNAKGHGFVTNRLQSLPGNASHRECPSFCCHSSTNQARRPRTGRGNILPQLQGQGLHSRKLLRRSQPVCKHHLERLPVEITRKPDQMDLNGRGRRGEGEVPANVNGGRELLPGGSGGHPGIDAILGKQCVDATQVGRWKPDARATLLPMHNCS